MSLVAERFRKSTSDAYWLVSHSAALFQQICVGVVCQALQRFRLGQLTVRMPSGSTRRFGQTSLPVVPDPFTSPCATMTVHDLHLFESLCLTADIGLAEAYIRAEWDSEDVAGVLRWFMLNLADAFPDGQMNASWQVSLIRWANRLEHRLRPDQPKGRSKPLLSRDAFNLFDSCLLLDPRLGQANRFSLGWEGNIEAAQQNWWEALCQKLRLRPGDHVLELGSGGGAFACYAAAQYGCRVTIAALLPAQSPATHNRVTALELSHLITVHEIPADQLMERYDKIAIVDMPDTGADTVWDTVFTQCRRLLKPHGLMVLHGVTCPDNRYWLCRSHTDFLQQYLLSDMVLPSIDQLYQAIRRVSDLFLHELDDLGNSYALTLLAWDANFLRSLPNTRAQGFDEGFIRRWHYYLQYAQAAFSTRTVTVIQAVFTRSNNPLLMLPAASFTAGKRTGNLQ